MKRLAALIIAALICQTSALFCQKSALASELTEAWQSGAKDLFFKQLERSGDISNYGLTYSIELERNGQVSKVDSRYPFQSGDKIRFHVRSDINGYMYIFMTTGSSGNQAVLFPADDGATFNQVVAGMDYVLPKNGVLVFDDKPGLETIQLVLSANKFNGEDSRQSRSIIIKPKEKPQVLDKQCLLSTGAGDHNGGATDSRPGIDQPSPVNAESFMNDPAMSMVSQDTSHPLVVEMILQHYAPHDIAFNAAPPRLISAPPTVPLAAALKKPPALTGKQHSGTQPEKTAPDSPIPDKWALVVGVSNFKDPLLHLNYPAKDATDFAQFLTREANFAPDHVRLLTDNQATRERILTNLGSGWLPHNVKPGDLVVIYIAGHGTAAESDVAGKNFLVVYDTDPRNPFVSGIEIQDLTRTLKRRLNTDRIVVVLDTCHSGAAETGAKGLPPLLSPWKLEPVLQGAGQLVIASSGANQVAHDSKRYQNGIFTRNFINGLRRFPVLENAFAFARQAVESESVSDFGQSQVPVLKDGDWQGTHLVLSAPPARPRSVNLASGP